MPGRAHHRRDRLLGLAAATALGAALGAAEPAGGGEGPVPAASEISATIAGEVLHANTLEIGNFSLSDVVARPTLVDQVLTFSDCRASAYGGTAVGSLTVDFRSNKERCVLDVDNVDLIALLSDFGATPENFGGKLSGHIELTFPAGHIDQMSARGTFAIRDGNLVELPFLANLLVGDISNTRGQDSAEGTFEISDRLVKFSSATVTMPKGRLLITGTVSLDGDLRLRVIPHVGNFLGISSVPLLGKVLENVFGSATSYVARALVRGHISKPQIVMNPFGE
jgi:hypothetical protein